MVQLSPIESAIGTGIGEHAPEPRLPDVDARLDPLAALEQAVLPGLRRPPCLVAFSGGRDSSAVLAVATHVARREGLPLPVPTTKVFPRYPETDESRWQEIVIGHLELPDWHRTTFGPELNMLGPVAQAVIRRHGPIAPAGLHDIVPTLQEADHGTVFTGIEGDGLFNGGSFARMRAVLTRRAPPKPRDILTLAKRGAPPPLRRLRDERQAALVGSWLRPDAEKALRRALARESSSEPLRWNRRVHWWSRRRYVIMQRQALGLLAEDAGVLLLHPLLDPTFLSALARWGDAFGCGDRTDLMRALFGSLLPPQVLEREDKALFTRAFWSGDTRAFIEGWDGGGVPDEIVDPEMLRSTWLEDSPDACSGLLLQAAWAATSGGGQIKQPFNYSLD